MTISIRRAGAVLLGLVFLLALFLVLAGLAANATIARPGFVSDQLEEADAYQFVLDDLVPALLEDAWQLDADEFGLEFEENPLAASGLTPEQVAAAIRRAIPPEDLEALVSPAIEGAMDYVIGREEEVAIRLDAGANLDALVLELTTLSRETGAYERLLERELTPVFGRWVDEGLPPGGEDSAWVAILRGASGEEGGSLARVFTHVATPEWMAAQVEGAANAGVDYAVARSDTLAIRIGFDENEVEQAAAEIAAVITEADAFDVAYTNVVEPATRESIPEVSTLPYGVVLTRHEVVEAVRDAVAGDWLDAQAAVLAADVAAYATGQTDAFVTTFDLAAAKPEAWHALTALATTSLRQALRDLPECATAAENGAARAALDRELPSCIPWDVPPADIVAIAVPAIATAIDETVLNRIPDLVTYSEQDLRDNLERDGGSDALLALDEIRELFREGWTYTDGDLRADLDDDAFDLIEDARLALSTGYVLQASDESPEGLEEGLDEVRDAIALGAGDLWIPALIAAALLLLIGFLGGRSWRGRFAWAAGVLLLSAAVLAVLFWTVAQSVSDGALDDIREEIALDSDSQFPSTSEALADKLVDVAASAVDDVAGNIARNTLILAVVGAVGVIVAVFWGRIGAALGRDQL
ncbi:MAG: hypothetical protein F4081_08615 [Dehalococcoidia bacterium]|nr:hypothetical protein [Dehalococcoidia bacterium]MYI86821.1 hypothetical protein [Dehalococcoidia bacterium]